MALIIAIGPRTRFRSSGPPSYREMSISEHTRAPRVYGIAGKGFIPYSKGHWLYLECGGRLTSGGNLSYSTTDCNYKRREDYFKQHLIHDHGATEEEAEAYMARATDKEKFVC